MAAVPAVPDGTVLATGGDDFTIRLRDTDPHRVATRVCAGAYPRITGARWTRHFTAVDLHPPCPAG
ncbi:hypothetical protein BCL76_11987 [Streptomyces sp. CG 926]|uniref:hypothetical protein n=1 Tax=Streptomyces sp. CG 926 TaxID=1882405 RepID=UPI000D6BA49A|nr:hypothetical protein [Streptomyces sp. CG 926]PWK63661.1 hypothetical protein BCL76_11987 [Streptomyces sp. CG 926]